MTNSVIQNYFNERKEAWLKKTTNTSMSDTEVAEKKIECDQLFSLENWLPSAAKRAGQMSLATHPCTFSHPSARKNKNGYVTPIIATAIKTNDGYLRSGNVAAETDALGNAAAIDVYKFLTLEMPDGQNLIEHIRNESDLAVRILTINSEQYERLRDGFLTMVEISDDVATTSSKIKQVFFPVSDDYHQLSILSNSGLMFEFRKRIDAIRFSDEVKQLRVLKRNNELSEKPFMELYNLTTIGYGGTKPQNISVLNNQNGGKAHLLLSSPPVLNKRDIHFPKHNFFGESLRPYECRETFDALHRLFKTEYNNSHIREGVDYRLQELIDKIIERMWAVRAVAEDQHYSENSQLKTHQKIWLGHEDAQSREDYDEWLDKLCTEISNWLIHSYEKLLGKQAYKLGEAERQRIHDKVTENREALR